MLPITFGAQGAYIVIEIGGKPYPLKSGDISTSGTLPQSMKFQFKDYENPIKAGTLQQFFRDLELAFGTQAEPFMDRWETLSTNFADAPIIGSAMQTVQTTDIQIVEAAFELHKNQPETGKFSAMLQFGVLFIPENPPHFLSITIKRFGTVLTLGLTGDLAELADKPAGHQQ